MATEAGTSLRDAEACLAQAKFEKFAKSELNGLDDKIFVFGIRVLTHVTSKTALSFDGTTFKNIDEIKDQFCRDVSSVNTALLKVVPEAWRESDKRAKAHAKASSKADGKGGGKAAIAKATDCPMNADTAQFISEKLKCTAEIGLKVKHTKSKDVCAVVGMGETDVSLELCKFHALQPLQTLTVDRFELVEMWSEAKKVPDQFVDVNTLLMAPNVFASVDRAYKLFSAMKARETTNASTYVNAIGFNKNTAAVFPSRTLRLASSCLLRSRISRKSLSSVLSMSWTQRPCSKQLAANLGSNWASPYLMEMPRMPPLVR